MKLNKIIVILFISLFLSNSVCALPIKITGKVIGLKDTDKVVLKNLMGDTLYITHGKSGEFIIDGAIDAPSIYTIHLGNLKNSLYIDKDSEVSGFLDANNPNNSKLSFLFTENNNVLVQKYLDIKRIYDVNTIKYSSIINSATASESEKNEAISKMSYMFREQDVVKESILKINDANIQAAIAFMFRGDSHDSAKYIYNLLSKEVRKTYTATLLKQFIKSKDFLRIGYRAPDFTISDIEGGERSLRDFKGKIVVLDFWASWCGPCRSEMAFLKKIYDDYKKRNVIFVSISLDKNEQLWSKSHNEENIEWVSLWGGDWNKTHLRDLYDFSSIPHIVIIDEKGRYVGKNFRRNSLINQLDKLLK